ncbi:MAG: hypothetical protein HY901_19420 [Deltaproteobacteria bacterium]|nr:hypothetical protein [Deltaproteobacteria bacterium]
MTVTTLALAVLLASTTSQATDTPFGAVACAPLERGGYAVYGAAGYPELRVGFRQGFQGFEVGAEAGLGYLSMDFFATAAGRRTLLQRGAMNLALDAKLGGFVDAGSRWAVSDNRSEAGLRVEIGSSLTYKTHWPLSWLAFVKVPAEIPFTSEGSVRVAGLLGGGAEIALSNEYFLLLNGAFGPDFRTHVPQSARLSVEAMLGFGYRVF